VDEVEKYVGMLPEDLPEGVGEDSLGECDDCGRLELVDELDGNNLCRSCVELLSL
jgi:hypothetical protein